MPISLTRNRALRQTQFYLLWAMLFINVTVGIGILAQASPMMQDMFHRTAIQAAAVVSLISVFNAGGRFLWASTSDYIGRRNTYLIFFATQFVLFLVIPGLAASGNWPIFQAALFTSSRCMEGGSPPYQHSLPTSSAPTTSARSTARGSRPGAPLPSWDR